MALITSLKKGRNERISKEHLRRKKKKISAAAHTQKSLQSDVAAFFLCVCLSEAARRGTGAVCQNTSEMGKNISS